MAAYICVMGLRELGTTRGCAQTSEEVGGKHLRGSSSRNERKEGRLGGLERLEFKSPVGGLKMLPGISRALISPGLIWNYRFRDNCC